MLAAIAVDREEYELRERKQELRLWLMLLVLSASGVVCSVESVVEMGYCLDA